MIKFIHRLLGIKATVEPKVEIKPEIRKPAGIFTTDFSPMTMLDRSVIAENAFNKAFQKKQPVLVNTPGVAMDAKSVELTDTMDSIVNAKAEFMFNQTMPDSQVLWYASQSFIGYQLCALISQHWLVAKACLTPAKDAIRNGYEITVNDGTEIDPEVLDAIRKGDVKYKINKNLIELVQMGRIFGIRIALFEVEYDDPEAYSKPFNIDGVKEGRYKGISQVDPYWITPQLSNMAAGDPSSKDFYEPTWWRINGRLIHRSHLVIFRTEELPDILKPTYLYGGVSIPQKIYERVYAAERTANEAPQLALTKRTDVITADMTEVVANQQIFDLKMQLWAFNRDNYGIKTIGLEEKMEQFDTSLADLDVVIMTQYQLVAAAANMPAVKLLGTSPKGFNTTGEFEEANYHEELESIQTHDLQPLLERHHQLLIKSDICPMFDIQPFPVTVTFNPLDAMTAKEEAELNKLKADTGQVLMTVGAIDGEDERQRIINDPASGYTGLVDEIPEQVENDPIGA